MNSVLFVIFFSWLRFRVDQETETTFKKYNTDPELHNTDK